MLPSSILERYQRRLARRPKQESVRRLILHLLLGLTLSLAPDLYMQPNMNASNVKNAEAQKRKDDSIKAAAKREKDKNDLKKQK